MIEFARSLGAVVHDQDPDPESFDVMPFMYDSWVWVVRGEFYVDPDRFHVGDFLHELGHWAVLPEFARLSFTGDVEESTYPVITAYVEAGRLDKKGKAMARERAGRGDDPVMRACLQCGDSEAIAWSYAAAVHVGVDPGSIAEKGFAEKHTAKTILVGLSVGAHMGIHGLRASGFMGHKSEWPKLRRWLAP